MTAAFNDQYFRDLPIKVDRYEVTVTEDLVLCVFPNNLKSWVYLYTVQGYQRRRTLGLFPEMDYKAALDRLPEVQRIVAAEAHNLRQAPPVRAPRCWLSLIFAGVTGMALGLLIGGFWDGMSLASTPRPTLATPQDDKPTATAPPIPCAPTASSLPCEPDAKTTTMTAADDAADATDATDATDVADTRAASEPPRSPVQSPPPDATSPAAPPDSPVAVSPRRDDFIIRAQLTSEIVEREPTDQLRGMVAIAPDDERPVYYFTELHGLMGQTVLHRWYFEGELQSEVPFAVGSGWRWRIYSLKRIPGNQTGNWRVEAVLAADGRHIAMDRFQVVTAASGY